jgi:hypothetical protein
MNVKRPPRAVLLAVGGHPALLGVLIAVGLNWATLAPSLSHDQYEGADAATVRQFLANEYRVEVLRAVGLTFALSIVVGLVLGVVVDIAVRLRNEWLHANTRFEHAPIAQSVVGICSLYFLVWIDDVVVRPALYQDMFIDSVGLLRRIQPFLTDHVNRVGLWSFALCLLLVWLLWPITPGSLRKVNRRAVATVAGVLTIGAAVTLCPWHRVSVKSSLSREDNRVNVLIIAADSLRPDRINRLIAPNLTALKNQGVEFTHAYTPLARTFPAWVSLLTGNYPHHHGIRNMFPRWEARTKNFHAVPSSFAQAGYTTSVVSDFAGDIFRRIDLGFQKLDTPTLNMRELLLERILQKDVALLPWLRGPLARWAVPAIREMHVASDAETLTRDALTSMDDSGSQPFFLTVFYSTTHFPYAAPAPFYKKFTNPRYSGRFRYAKADTLNEDAVLSADDVAQVRGLFDGAVAAVDAAVGALIEGMTSRGLRNRTLIVITADHGESLYEYGRGQGHGDHLQGDESLHVPLIILNPGSQPAHVSTNVSLIDLAPTLCELTDTPCRHQMDGHSLAAATHGRDIAPYPVFAETGLWFTESLPEVSLEQRIPYPDLVHLTEIDRSHTDEIVIRHEWEDLTTAAKHRMVRDGEFKLVYMPTRSGPKFTLINTATDAGEVSDVASKFPAVVERLKSTLMQWMLADTSMDSRDGILVPRTPNGAAGNVK